MNARPYVSRCRWIIAAGSLMLILSVTGLGLDSVPPEALNVKVFPDRFVAAGKPFSDIAALEAWAKPIRIRTLWLDSCGNGSTKQLLAAVERLHSAYAEGVQIRTFAANEPACLVAGEQAGMSRLLVDAAYLATDQLGRSTMP